MSHMTNMEEVEVALRGMAKRGEIAPNILYQGMICLAYEHALLGCREEVDRLIQIVTPEYVDTVMPVQMDADPDFYKVAHVLAAYIRKTKEEDASSEQVVDAILAAKPTTGLAN
jgi:hypothetical protein